MFKQDFFAKKKNIIQRSLTSNLLFECLKIRNLEIVVTSNSRYHKLEHMYINQQDAQNSCD